MVSNTFIVFCLPVIILHLKATVALRRVCMYMHACVCLTGVRSHNLAGVRLCKIKSTSAGSHSDKINRIWHFLRWRQMLAPLPSEHFPLSSVLHPNYISSHFEDIFPPPLTLPGPQQDPSSPLIWFLILLLQGSVMRTAPVTLEACFMPYWGQLARSTHFHLSRQMTINADVMHACLLSRWYSKWSR